MPKNWREARQTVFVSALERRSFSGVVTSAAHVRRRSGCCLA